jgi:translation initiation factor 3 subunit K
LGHRYQFNPDLYNPDVVVNILLKALVHPEHADFNLCLALIDERPQTSHLDEPDPMPALLPQLSELYSLLVACRFPAFWKSYASDELQSLRENYTVEVAGFEDAVRTVVVHSVAATFTRIGTARLSSYLNLTGVYLHPTELDEH